MRVDLNEIDPNRMDYHTVNIMIKMNVSDTPGGEGADIGLTFSERNFETYADTIENLHIGDHVRFNSTIITLGDAFHLHHFRAQGIEKIDGHMDVHPHASR